MTIKSVFDKLGPRPPCGELIDWTLLDYDKDEGRIEISFSPPESFANPRGFIQGGFLSAMLDETMGGVVIIATDAKFAPTTISLSVDFIRPAAMGKVFGVGKLVNLGKSIAFMEAELHGIEGKLLAKSQASARLFPLSAE
ncbi:MAG: PaaI family thioesterase [Parvularculales bacterium]